MSGKSATAAAAVLQLQQQHHFESIQIVKLVPSLVIINELLSKLFNLLPFPALFLVLQLQQQCCNCSSLLNPLRISNYPCVPSMVIINDLLLELFNTTFKWQTFPLSDFFNISPVMSVGKNKNRGKKISLRIFRFYHDFDGIWMMVVDHFATT